MLSSLKEKILNVSLFTNNEEQLLKNKSINIHAGAGVLAHFQNKWEELHVIQEKNATNANTAAYEIERISSMIDNNKKNLVLISYSLSSSYLINKINKCLDSVNELYKASEILEKNLIQLEDLIDQIDFEKMKNRHKYHLQQYELRQVGSLNEFKSNLEAKHLEKIEEYETNKRLLLKERQQVFQDAFKNDLETYKNSGTVPPKIQKRNQNGALLEEIQLDFDQKELENFFNDDNLQ